MNMKIAGLLGVVALAASVTTAGATAVSGTVRPQDGVGSTARAGSADTAAMPNRGVQVAETVIIRRGGGYHRPYHPMFHRPFHREHERVIIRR